VHTPDHFHRLGLAIVLTSAGRRGSHDGMLLPMENIERALPDAWPVGDSYCMKKSMRLKCGLNVEV
jgi:hypothetical protein